MVNATGSSLEAIDVRNREVFDQWQASHYAFDFPKAGGRGGTIEEFLKEFVPSPVTVPSNPPVQKIITTLTGKIPTTGRSMTYGSAVQIAFTDTSRLKLPSPAGYDHFTAPSILGPYPGQPALTSNHRWDKYSLAIEVKFDADPVNQPANKVPADNRTVETIAQLVKNGANLLLLLRAVIHFVSCGFHYDTKPHILREFLWRVVNPHHGIPNTVVGWDETIRIPSDVDIVKLKEIIKPSYPSLMINKDDCRWMKVRLSRAAFESRMNETGLRSTSSTPPMVADSRDADLSLLDSLSHLTPLTSSDPDNSENSQADTSLHSKDSKECHPELTYEDVKDPRYYDLEGLTFGPPLCKSSHLVSRATYVTRILVKVPGHGPHVFVLKDSWHQRNRKPESEFYEKIKERFPLLKVRPEFAWVKKIYPDIDTKPNWIPGLAEYYGCLKLSDMSSHLSDIRGHTTVSHRLLTGQNDSDRVRVRTLTGPVGSHIADFVKTKDFATVMRDGIIGHYIARECGVLHRDISDGNILVENIGDQARGFLHDFDHATFYKCDLDTAVQRAQLDNLKHELKMLTGTRQFLAIEIIQKASHMPYHDLESFYWVMVYIFLRYSVHNSELGNEACRYLFDHPHNFPAIMAKGSWILHTVQQTLTDLMKDLRGIFRTYCGLRMNCPNHEQLAQAMEMRLNAPGWPTSDSAVYYKRLKEPDIDKVRIAALNAAEADIPPEELLLQENELPGPATAPDEDSPIMEKQSKDVEKNGEPSQPRLFSWLSESRKRRLTFYDDEEHVRKKVRYLVVHTHIVQHALCTSNYRCIFEHK
ncbi:hypothetical protein BDQ17DRAFT_1365016 [Cyathus striatus]|nr:hypothetical protein BDQ17DRAFT_1365016 [Cyathus striatus]